MNIYIELIKYFGIGIFGMILFFVFAAIICVGCYTMDELTLYMNKRDKVRKEKYKL